MTGAFLFVHEHFTRDLIWFSFRWCSSFIRLYGKPNCASICFTVKVCTVFTHLFNIHTFTTINGFLPLFLNLMRLQLCKISTAFLISGKSTFNCDDMSPHVDGNTCKILLFNSHVLHLSQST